jgi:hypothetical protein
VKRLMVAVVTATALGTGAYALTAVASSGSSPPNPQWHVHDGGCCVPTHRPIGFFWRNDGRGILNPYDQTLDDYTADPAECPNATDKAFLPSGATPAYTDGEAAGASQSTLLRAGMCQTSQFVIQVSTVPAGTAGPSGWTKLPFSTDGGGFWTYYLLTPH